LPIELKVYAATSPKTLQMMLDGIKAAFSSEKNATPLGSESTPAPMILFAKLNIDVAIVASPDEDCATIALSPSAATVEVRDLPPP